MKPLRIPACIVGDRKTAKSRTRRFVKQFCHERPYRFNPWPDEFVEFADVTGRIVLDHPSRHLDSFGDEAYVVFMMEMIHDVTSSAEQDREVWSQDMMSLVDSALDEFWMCLCLLAGGVGFPPSTAYKTARGFHVRLLRSLLRWWPQFCAVDDRFCDGIGLQQPGYKWGRGTWDSLKCLGVDAAWIRNLQELEPEDAAIEIAGLLAKEPQ